MSRRSNPSPPTSRQRAPYAAPTLRASDYDRPEQRQDRRQIGPEYETDEILALVPETRKLMYARVVSAASYAPAIPSYARKDCGVGERVQGRYEAGMAGQDA